MHGKSPPAKKSKGADHEGLDADRVGVRGGRIQRASPLAVKDQGGGGVVEVENVRGGRR